MNKFVRFVALAITVTMCLSVIALPASAEEIMVEDINKEETDRMRAVILPDIVEDGAATTKLFTLTANAVYNTLNTSGIPGKYIIRDQLPVDANSIYVYGSLDHSVNYEDTIYDQYHMMRTGLCSFYNGSDYAYPDFYTYVASGVDFAERLCGKYDLDRHATYYGFVTNMFSSGYVSGEVTFAYV